MSWRIALAVRNSTTGDLLPGQIVQLYEGDGTGSLVGTFTDNTDGTYFFDMSAEKSLVGTIKINGVIQAEKVEIPFIGEDVIEHLTLESFGGSGVADSVHGLETGDGDFVGTDKVQTLTNKILDDSNEIVAAAIVSGTLHIDRIPASIPDSKLATITTGNKVSGSAVQLNSAGGLEDSSGLKIKPNPTTPTIEVAAAGVQVRISAGSYPGLQRLATGLAFDPTTMQKIETVGKVSPVALDITWQNPRHFTDTDRIDQAISKIDYALWALRLDQQNVSARVAILYAQGGEAARANAASDLDDVDDPGYWFLGGNVGYTRKLVIPVAKSNLSDVLIIKGQFCNEGAGETTSLRVQVKNQAGAVLGHTTRTVTGTDWTSFNIHANLPTSGFYWVDIALKGTDGGGDDARLRNLIIALGSTSYIQLEVSTDAVWAANEASFNLS